MRLLGVSVSLWLSHRAQAPRSRPKALAVLDGSDEGLYHLRVLKVSIELIQLRQPEIIAGVIRVRRIIGIASQVTKELHQNERAVGFSAHQVLMFSDRAQHLRPRLGTSREPGC